MNMDGSGDFTCKSDGNQTVVKEHQSSTSTVALKQSKQDKNLPSYEEVSVKNNISFININNIDNNKLNKMGKHNGTSDVDKDDEAQERMLKDDVKVSIVPSKETSDVKFISENGDAKIDIKNVKQSLSGMGKAELMKYANDPFWVYLRWFFFIAFWLLWIAMLAGAIAIVVMAPKCSAPEPKKWYEESPIIKIDLAEDDVKDLQDLSKVLDNLKEQNIKAISLNSVFKQSTQGSPENFKEVNPKLGKIEDFQLFLKTAKDNKQHVIMEFDPNHSSNMHEWFIKSENKEEPYTSFYIWADGKIDNEDKSRKPPNEWKNVENQSAWKYSSKRNQYYLHQFKETQPDLNYHNSNVTDAITDALKFWLNLGISGFNFINTQFLTEDPDLLDNPLTTSLHAPKIRTEGRADNNKLILKEWRQVILNYTEGQGLLSLNEELSNDTFIVYNDEKNGNVLVNLPKTVNILRFSNRSSIAKSLKDNVDRMLKSSKWPSFELFNKNSLENNNRNAEVSESLAIMALLLPATPIMKYNEFMSLNTSKALNTLVKARSGLSFLHGKTETYVLNNGTVFAYTRLKSGNPGYLVAYNSGENQETMDISKIPIVPEEVNIATYSLNYNTNNTIKENKLDSKSVFMPPKSTLVVTFAPKL